MFLMLRVCPHQMNMNITQLVIILVADITGKLWISKCTDDVYMYEVGKSVVHGNCYSVHSKGYIKIKYVAVRVQFLL